MLRRWAAVVWDLVKGTWAQWRSHRSAEMASALAYYGALSIAGLALIAVYVAGAFFGGEHARRQTTGQAGHIAGPQNAHALDVVIRAASGTHLAWIALVAGVLIFLLAVAGTAFQLQRVVDVVWDVAPTKERGRGEPAAKHAPAFAAIYVLALLLVVLLLAGAAVHGLANHTHQLPFTSGLLYQALDVGASIVLLTFVFLFIFAYLPPVNVPWRNAWIAAFASAVLYERGQFGLAIYFGAMQATSPYADVGALLAVLLWLYYSAEVVIIGAEFTRALKERTAKQNGGPAQSPSTSSRRPKSSPQ